MAPQTDRPIFVIGCPRSGTTLLQLMLHSHPRIAIPVETRFVLQAYDSRRDFGDLRDSANRRALAQWIVGRRQSRFRDLGLDPKAVAAEIVAGPPTLGSALGIVFRAYARRFGKPRWGDKRPAYAKHVDALLRMWPDAQFVHVVRDGRDCVASLKEMPWYRHDIHHAIANWREAVDDGRRNLARLGPEAFHLVRYEHLVTRPEEELTQLCAFLGEEYHPAMAAPQGIAETTMPKGRTWHFRTKGEVTSGRVGSWAQRLEPWEVGLVETVLGSRLRAHGYEPSGTARPSPLHLARYARVAAHRRAAQRKNALVRGYRRLSEPGPVVSLLTEHDSLSIR
ncbi:sulfotransferase [Actinomadura craniellae]|uniref:Sulfotransferase n=1 Tax=Actinomadura craniellae TaxID=2231787 RepID=A0A365GX66_9ACTN|nr:sulfotransferase [Actinomadura craniellae]RAY11427.1 sulfotransferase [Actinomadura craniellae]